jgi:WD40 repeat protein/serine/threonine protein kinase
VSERLEPNLPREPSKQRLALSIPQMAAFSRLLDEALPLDAAARGRWLLHLAPEHRDLAELLRQALLPAEIEDSGLSKLSTLPKFDASDAAGLVGDGGLQPGERLGPYELIRPLGAGGMAEVWLARRADGAFKRDVALKLPLLMRPRRDLEPRFAREREILASLTHPNIARLYDAGFTQHGQPYLALEYVAGTPITNYCDDRRLTPRERLMLFGQVLGAVQYAHANLVIHRDLKPSNILVTEEGQVQLLDFGIAKLLSDGEAKETELTQLGGRALTPDYAAPEQIAGAPITTAADVYALGVMLYEILTGERPYRLKRDSRSALEEAILLAEPIAPSRSALSEGAARARATSPTKLAKALKGELDTIVMKALKKNPADRYATANAFDEDISRFLRGDVVLAQPDSLAYRVLKFTRRHRVGIAATGVLILTLAGGLAATSYEAKVASAQRDLALQAQLRSLTQTAAARLTASDVPGAMGIILEVLPRRGAERTYTAEALGVFEEARASDALISILQGHTGWVVGAAFAPDGQRLVTGSFDRTARVWDTATGRELMQLRGHADRVWTAAFSPDGQRIVTASFDKTAAVWDAATGRQIVRLIGHGDHVWSAAFSPDGARIVTASEDKSARIWDGATGREMRRLEGHTDLVQGALFSPDGARIVTASRDKSARIWDAASGRQLAILIGHTDRVNSAAFSSDGARIVTASHDKTARVWDAKSGRQLVLLSGHTDRVTSAAFSPDAERIVTTSADKSVRIWSASSGQPIRILGHHDDVVTCAAFSPDGRRIVSGSSDQTARIWDASTNRELLRLAGHADRLSVAAFSPAGDRIVTGSYDRTAWIWDAATGRALTRLIGHTDRVFGVAFSPDGERIATASDDKTARIWEVATGRELVSLTGHTERTTSAAFSPDGGRLVTASSDNSARIWDIATRRELLRLSLADPLSSAMFSPDGRRVVTSADDDTARLWDAATGHEILRLSGHAGRLQSAAFSPDGRRVVTAADDDTARIWDAGTGEELMRLSGHADAVTSAAFSPDGGRVVTASLDKTVRVWDTATGREFLLLVGHTDRVGSALFSPDGERVVTASFDGTARVWDVRTPSLESQIAWASAAQFDPLQSPERFRLGIAPVTDVRSWPHAQSKCDQAAAAPYDPDRRAPGVPVGQIAADIATAACGNAEAESRDGGRLAYQQGRALMARRDYSAARAKFEAAVGAGYRSARIDLARLMSLPDAGMLDVAKAITLYSQAWRDGLSVAAFELGRLYEPGDDALAWDWYRKAAEAGDPGALARLAERNLSSASIESGAAKRTADLLEAFKHYAAAAERARREDWPDEAWRGWRHRRAALARVLEREGMMQQVADAYEAVRDRYAQSR